MSENIQDKGDKVRPEDAGNADYKKLASDLENPNEINVESADESGQDSLEKSPVKKDGDGSTETADKENQIDEDSSSAVEVHQSLIKKILTSKRNRILSIAIVAALIVAAVAGYFYYVNTRVVVEYEEFEQNYTLQTVIKNGYYSVNVMSDEADGPYTYYIYDFLDNEDIDKEPLFIIETDEKAESLTITGTEYNLIISYPDKEEVTIKSLYDTELGKSYTDSDWNDYVNKNYPDEIREYYEDYVMHG